MNDVKSLREATGAGMLDCKKALEQTSGDVDGAIEFLRKKGLASAAKKASREANDGLVSALVNDGGTAGVLIEVNCETDFVARNENFQNFVNSLAEQALADPALDSVEKLLDAPSAEDDSKTVKDVLPDVIVKLGENIVIRNLVRFEVDENGLLDTYIHMGGKVGVLVEAANGQDKEKAYEVLHDVALQIAAAAPLYVTVDEIPQSFTDKEREVFQAQLAEDKKPDNIKEKIIDGKLKKRYSEVALLEQPFVKDSNLTVAKLLKTHSNDFKINRFARFQLGAS